MFSITNEKVAGFAPRWAQFRGFSILFDPPGTALMPSGNRLDLACDVEADPALGFYKRLRDGLARLNPDLLTATYLFCPLPPPSYHVTVWDGGNDGNVEEITGDARRDLESWLAGLPDSLGQEHRLTAPALASPLTRRDDWDIEFRFDHLAVRSALVARLVPTEASQNTYDEFVEERRRLNSACRAAFGIATYDNYTPHVSLGYFANREGVQAASLCLRDWNEAFTKQMQGQTVTFRRAGLYGFTDMATFFKKAAPVAASATELPD